MTLQYHNNRVNMFTMSKRAFPNIILVLLKLACLTGNLSENKRYMYINNSYHELYIIWSKFGKLPYIISFLEVRVLLLNL